MKIKSKLIVAAMAATVMCAGAAHAGIFLNFDGLPSGTAANSFAPPGLTFQFGVYAPNQDSYGDDIPGTEHWQVNTGTVLATNPALRNYGVAPSPNNALDGVDQTVMLLFSSALNIQQFSTKLDNSTFGNLGAQNIEFYDSTDLLLYSLPVNETVPGFLAGFTGNLANVSKIVLPNNAFFDDININNFVAVPEPGTWAAGAFGIACAAVSLRRKR